MALPLQAPANLFEGLGDFYAKQKQQAALMAQKKLMEQERIRQFNEKLAETSRHNQSMESNQNLRNDLLKAKIESEKAKVKTPMDKLQEKKDIEQFKFNMKEGHEIRNSANQAKSIYDRASRLKQLIEENPELTGPIKGKLVDWGLIDDDKISEFIELTGKLQADIARYGSKLGGIQALKWAGLVKPSHLKGHKFNLGMVNSILKNAENDYYEYANQYQDIEGKPLSVRLTSNKNEQEGEKTSGKSITIRNKKTGEKKTISYEEAKDRGYIK